MTKQFKPLRACKAPEDLTTLKFPLVASPKLDGIRCVIKDGEVLTRKLLRVPNKFIQRVLTQDSFLEGLDGELIVGIPNAPDTWNKTQSGVMSIEGEPDFTFHVFDDFTMPDWPFYDRTLDVDGRYQSLCERLHGEQREGYPIKCVPQIWIETFDDLIKWQMTWVNQGYEGAMLRTPLGRYKFGQSTEKEQILLKLKIWEDAEAEIKGFVEQMKNTSEATVDALGNTKRNKRKDNQEGKDTLGAIVCGWDRGPDFEIGTGFDDETRAHIWNNQSKYLKAACKFKFLGLTVESKPRFGTYLGVRDARD